jgi:predicted  nucleic acid-binding Zn-ribbon protein
MKKKLVIIIFIVIIQLFCYGIHAEEQYIQAASSNLTVTEVILKGNETYTTAWIFRHIDLEDYSSLTSQEIVQNKANEIQKLYRDNGFYFATCDYTIEELPEGNQSRLIYSIFEGKQVLINKVSFKGNFFIDSDKLNRIIYTKPSGFFARRFLIEENLTKDKAVIEDFYRKKGIEAIVSQVEKVFSAGQDSVTITYTVSEQQLTEGFQDQKARSIRDQFKLIQDEVAGLKKQLNEYKNRSESLNEELAQKQNELSLAKNEISGWENEKKTFQEKIALLEKKLQENEDVKDMLTGYLAQERSKAKDSLGETEKIRDEINRLSTEIESIKKEKDDLSTKLADARNEVEKEKKEKDMLKEKLSNFTSVIETRISEIDKVNTQLAVLLDETRSAISRELDSIELSTVVVTGDKKPEIIMKQDGTQKIFVQDLPKPKEADEALTSGRVLSINKKMSFLIISLGKTQGVKENMNFGVFRNNELIANVKVIEVRDQISGAEIYYLKEDTEVSEGDEVKLLNS